MYWKNARDHSRPLILRAEMMRVNDSVYRSMDNTRFLRGKVESCFFGELLMSARLGMYVNPPEKK